MSLGERASKFKIQLTVPHLHLVLRRRTYGWFSLADIAIGRSHVALVQGTIIPIVNNVDIERSCSIYRIHGISPTNRLLKKRGCGMSSHLKVFVRWSFFDLQRLRMMFDGLEDDDYGRDNDERKGRSMVRKFRDVTTVFLTAVLKS
jgi:hypothetical protein